MLLTILYGTSESDRSRSFPILSSAYDSRSLWAGDEECSYGNAVLSFRAQKVVIMSEGKTKCLLSSMQQISHVDCDQCFGRLWWWSFCSPKNRVITTRSASVRPSICPFIGLTILQSQDRSRIHCSWNTVFTSTLPLLLRTHFNTISHTLRVFWTFGGQMYTFPHVVSDIITGGDFRYQLFQFVLTPLTLNALKKTQTL